MALKILCQVKEATATKDHRVCGPIYMTYPEPRETEVRLWLVDHYYCSGEVGGGCWGVM